MEPAHENRNGGGIFPGGAIAWATSEKRAYCDEGAVKKRPHKLQEPSCKREGSWDLFINCYMPRKSVLNAENGYTNHSHEENALGCKYLYNIVTRPSRLKSCSNHICTD